MIRHFFKVAWNRKRSSGLLIAEMFFAFLVLCAVATLDIYYLDNYHLPLGFSRENIWMIIANPGREGAQENTMVSQQVFQNLSMMEEIESVAGSDWCATPYVDAHCGNATKSGVGYSWGQVNDSFAEALGVEIVQGRWFSQEDEAQNWDPVVVNQELACELFGAEDPLGKTLSLNLLPGQTIREKRVVGVVADFRKGGEFEKRKNFLFERFKADERYGIITLRVHPGTTAAFEEKMLARIQGVARDWTFKVRPLNQMRANFLKRGAILPMVSGIISVFLLLMVGLGLMGVLWQSIAQRTRELGLRRALGATGRAVRWQLVGETLAMTSIGVAVGVLLFVQFPLLGVINGVSNTVYGYGLGIALLVIYSLVLLCGFYPSRLATRIQPAQALHYE